MMMETLLVRRPILAEVGPFDTSLASNEDADWFLRGQEKGLAFTILPEVLLHKRVHSGSATFIIASHADQLRLLRVFHSPAPAASRLTGAPLSTMTNQSLVSVVLPLHNAAPYLAEAIDSVLVQSHRPLEIIVVDDGSTDGSGDIAQSYGDVIRYVWQTNQGQAAAMNRGVALVGGDYLTFIAADDRWTPDKLAKQMAFIQQQPDVDLVFGMLKQFISPELTADAQAQFAIPEAAQPGYMAGTMLCRTSTFRGVGPLLENVTVGEFVDWYARAMEQGLHHSLIPEVLYWRRVHGSNLTVRRRDAYDDYARVLHAALQRRRAHAAANTETLPEADEE